MSVALLARLWLSKDIAACSERLLVPASLVLLAVVRLACLCGGAAAPFAGFRWFSGPRAVIDVFPGFPVYSLSRFYGVKNLLKTSSNIQVVCFSRSCCSGARVHGSCSSASPGNLL